MANVDKMAIFNVERESGFFKGFFPKSDFSLLKDLANHGYQSLYVYCFWLFYDAYVWAHYQHHSNSMKILTKFKSDHYISLHTVIRFKVKLIYNTFVLFLKSSGRFRFRSMLSCDDMHTVDPWSSEKSALSFLSFLYSDSDISQW